MSLLTLAGMGAGLFGSMNDRASIVNSVKAAMTDPSWGWDNALYDFMVQTIGIDPRDFQNGGGYRFRLPTFTVSVLAGTVGSKVIGKFVKPSTFDAIPYIGKKIKL